VIEFLDAANGGPVEVGQVKLALDMNMPGMLMHTGATISPAGRPGRYQAKIKPAMAGDWTVQISYEGPRGSGEMSFTATVRP